MWMRVLGNPFSELKQTHTCLRHRLQLPGSRSRAATNRFQAVPHLRHPRQIYQKMLRNRDQRMIPSLIAQALR